MFKKSLPAACKRILPALLALLLCALPAATAFADADADSTFNITQGVSTDELTEMIDSYTAENEATTAGMAVGIIQQGDLLLRKDYGTANTETGRALDATDVFEWGSISKLLLWVSAMQLQEEGKLDLSADIRGYLPEGFLTKLEYSGEITFYNLMHHNAGWQEVAAGLLLEEPYEGEIPLEKILRDTEPPQLYAPGEYVAYSNWGTALAGYIVERVSGQPYGEYVRENIFEPLGMEQTAIMSYLEDNEWVQAQRGRIAGHDIDGEKMESDAFHVALYPAGSTTGTMDDMLKFAAALLPAGGDAGPLFSKRATLDEFFRTTMYYSDGNTPRNAHGMWIEQYGVQTVGHGGNTNGFSTMLNMHPDTRTAVVVFTNQSNETVYTADMMELLFGRQQVTGGTAGDGIGGFYQCARTIRQGGGKLYSMMMTIPLTGGGTSMTIPFYGATFTPMEGNWTRIEGNMPYDVGEYMYSDYTADTPRLSISVMDFVRIPTAEGIFAYATILLFGLAVAYSLVCLVCSLANIIVPVRGRQPLTMLRAGHRIMSAAQIAFVFNIVLTIMTMLSLQQAEGLNMLRCGLSMLFIGLAVWYWVVLLRARYINKGGVRAVHYATGIGAVFTCVFIIFWQLCYMP